MNGIVFRLSSFVWNRFAKCRRVAIIFVVCCFRLIECDAILPMRLESFDTNVLCVGPDIYNSMAWLTKAEVGTFNFNDHNNVFV